MDYMGWGGLGRECGQGGGKKEEGRGGNNLFLPFMPIVLDTPFPPKEKKNIRKIPFQTVEPKLG